MEKIIYLDNAATTFPKPPEVISEITGIMRYSCGNPGRSSHRIALAASDIVFECREKLGSFFGCDPENVIFTSSATHSVNLAVKTVLHRGDHVLISDIEHNSVLRPIAALAEKGMISYSIYRAFEDADQQLREIRHLIRPSTAMICACHHSNIFNFISPIHEIGRFCRNNGIIFLVDASQSAGSVSINMRNDCIDLLCAPGHKGLYGPPGIGFALFGDRFSIPHNLPDTFTEGGNGINSTERSMPDFLPERLEAGTLAVPAIGGLSKGIDFVRGYRNGELYRNETQLCSAMRDRLKELPHIKIHGKRCGSILLFSVSGCDSEEFASMLDRFGICVRAGLHCAPLAHKKLGTPENGAVRVSFGAFNTIHDVNEFCAVTEKLLRK